MREQKPTESSGDITINVARVLDLLVDNLYGGDAHLTLRELIQNAHDALVEHSDIPISQKRISIRVNSLDTAPYIEVEDNGMGMDEKGVRKNLCIVGESSKLAKAKDNPNLIGKYGIGFMSAFIVADRVVVWTRAGQDAPTLEWETNKTAWTLKKSDPVPAITRGTRVRLYFKSEYAKSIGERVRDLQSVAGITSVVQRYCYLFPFVVGVENETGIAKSLTSRTRPWEDRAEALHAFKLFFSKNDPLYTHPFCVESEQGGFHAQGVLYFDRSLVHNPTVQLSVRRMLVDPAFPRLLPSYAVFCHALVECPELEIDLSRRHINDYDPALIWLREEMQRQFQKAFIEFAKSRLNDLYELWPKVDNSFTSQLLRIIANEELQGQPTWKLTENFIIEAGVHFPFFVIDQVSGAEGRPRMDTIANLSKSARDNSGISAGEKVKVYYTESKNPLEKEVLLNQYGDLIDASRDDRNDDSLMLILSKNNERFDSFVLVAVTANRFTALDEHENIRWGAMREIVQSGLRFYQRNHSVVMDRFKPVGTPVLIVDEKVDQDEINQVREQFASMAAGAGGLLANKVQDLLASLSSGRDQLVIHLNADHELLNELRGALDDADAEVVSAAREGIMNVAWRAVLDYYGWGSTREMLAQDRKQTQAIIKELLKSKKENAQARVQLRQLDELKALQVDAEREEYLRAIVGIIDLAKSTRTLVARSATAPVNISTFMQATMAHISTHLEGRAQVISFTGDGLLFLVREPRESRFVALLTLLRSLELRLQQAMADDPAFGPLAEDISASLKLRVALSEGDLFIGSIAGTRNVIGLPVVEAARVVSDSALYQAHQTTILMTDAALNRGSKWELWKATEVVLCKSEHEIHGSNNRVDLFKPA